MKPKEHASVNRSPAWLQLTATTAGLLYQSETEATLTPVSHSARQAEFGPNDARELAGRGVEEHVEELSIADFFAGPTEAQDWHGPDEKQAVARYRTLQQLFSATLTSAKAFKLGQIRVTILVIGRTAEGHWIGVRVEAVET